MGRYQGEVTVKRISYVYKMEVEHIEKLYANKIQNIKRCDHLGRKNLCHKIKLSFKHLRNPLTFSLMEFEIYFFFTYERAAFCDNTQSCKCHMCLL